MYESCADFICAHGLYGDMTIVAMEYRKEMSKILVQMQMEVDEINEIDEEEISREMEVRNDV